MYVEQVEGLWAESHVSRKRVRRVGQLEETQNM